MNYGCPDVCSGFERSGGGGGGLSGCEICDVTMKLVVLIKLLPIRLLQNQINCAPDSYLKFEFLKYDDDIRLSSFRLIYPFSILLVVSRVANLFIYVEYGG